MFRIASSKLNMKNDDIITRVFELLGETGESFLVKKKTTIET